ncbi:MAG: hypothetical protein L6U99_01755 [Clostridium sp.]|nr:MAG: hypothetical protein L6U99_01755 [Clostridium sp.]
MLKVDAVCVFVTFLDELSKYNKTIVSMVSTVIPSSPELRTLKDYKRRIKWFGLCNGYC